MTEVCVSLKARDILSKQDRLGPVEWHLHPETPAAELGQVGRTPQKPRWETYNNKGSRFVSKIPISLPNPIFDLLLESSHRDILTTGQT